MPGMVVRNNFGRAQDPPPTTSEDHLVFSDMHEASPYDKWDFLLQKFVVHGPLLTATLGGVDPYVRTEPFAHGLLLTATLGSVAP